MINLQPASAKVLIKTAVAVLGSQAALARALDTNPATVYRWRSGESKMPGPARVAIIAIINHPRDYRL